MKGSDIRKRLPRHLRVIAMAANQSPGIAVQFTDVTSQAGIHFTHNAGRAGKKYLPETWARAARSSTSMAMAGRTSCWSTARIWTPAAAHPAALYHNNHNGTFTDVTKGSGLDVEMYGIGVAIGDYDNDGRDDIYITALEGDHLFHNEGNGKFRDVTQAVGNPEREFRHQRGVARLRQATASSTCSSRIMCSGREKGDMCCSLDGATKSYCTPESYKGTRRGCITTWATADLKMSPKRPDSAIPPASRWAWRCSIITAMAGRISSSPTTPSPTSSIATIATAHSTKKAGGRRGVRRRRHGARRDGHGLGRLRSLRAAALLVGNFSNQMLGAVSQRRQRAVRG